MNDSPLKQNAPHVVGPTIGFWLRKAWAQLQNAVNPPPNAEDLREVVEELIDEPLSQSGLTQAERMLLGNIIKLRQRKVADCMTPRADIISGSVDSTLEAIVDLMAEHAHSRIPVFRGTLDDVIGMVHIKDIMPCIAYRTSRAITDLLRPVMFVAPSMPASKLLLQMRATRQHMAMVVDEYGGIDGLITIEDLVEEVVGEIDDEHDAPDQPLLIARVDGTYLVDARILISEFVDRTGIKLPPLEGEDIDTLGGYVVTLAGRVPHLGESFHGQAGVHFEVIELDQTRIKRLRIRDQPNLTVRPERQAKVQGATH